jgi:indole-3-glycerol phosphate synthase
MSTTASHQGTVLETILASTREQLAQRKQQLPLAELDAGPRPRAAGAGFAEALTAPGVAVIAEFKRRSPSAGALRVGADPGEIAAAYERGGASAMSVLTEGPHFEGSLEDLRSARACCRLPLLRKDFIVDAYQLHEAVAAGADAVLLIVAALSDSELSSLHAAAQSLGLDVLVEVHDREQLRRALAAGAQVIGINNRDLRDFSVDMATTLALVGAIPSGVLVVSESGIHGPEQLASLAQAGVHAVLVGGSLMRAPNPEIALKALLSPAA